MDMEEATKLATAGNPLTVDDLEQKMLEHHSGNVQRLAHATRGLGMVREGLGVLASLGHQYEIIEKRVMPGEVFPQMLYKQSSGVVVERTVESGDELKEVLKDGWAEHPSGRAPERVSEAVPPKKKFAPVKLWRDGETMMAESELELEEALDDGWSDEEPKPGAKPSGGKK
jgi:hypothetical protein